MSQLLASGGQNIGASSSASVFPMNIQGLFPLGLTGLILLSKGFSKVFFSTTVWKHQFFSAQHPLWSTSHMTTGKTIALTMWTFVGKVMSLLLNMLSRFVIAFLRRFQFSSVTQSCPTLCNPMNRSTPGLPVHHQLLEFTQTHVHRVGLSVFNFVAAVTVHSDFGAQENKICHCFHLFMSSFISFSNVV